MIDLIPWKTIQRLVDIVDTMHASTVEIYEARKKALRQGKDVVSKQVGRGKDILSILGMSFNILTTRVYWFSTQ